MEAEDVSVMSSASPDDLAYILYTSGSTGKPKGVAVRNRNVCHYVRAFQNEFHPGEADIMLQYSVCSFDIFVEEVFTTLLSGAVLAIPSSETKKNIHTLMEFVDKNNITEISGFPYLLLEMNHLPQIPKSLRLLISGGDVLRASYITNLTDNVEIYNTYGPSETTVCASYYRCNDVTPLADGTYPVGKPVLGTEIEILDEHLTPVKLGEIGEICILGDGVSAGYIGNREKENEAFVTWQDGSTLYRSGDLGYLLPDGNIAFLHRKDTQVMILGKRVEPVEVESVLCKCSEIEKAIVRPYTDEQNLSYMVAYIVLKHPEANLSTLKKEMARFLPNYMIPEFFIILLETIRYACDSVRMDEEAFMDAMRSASAVRDMGEVKKLKAGLKKQEKRFSELDMLLKKVYEDNAMGRLPDRRYEMLSSDYEKEQEQLEISMKKMQEQLAEYEESTDRTEEFLSLVHKYTDIRELTAPIINEFVDKVLVHKAERTCGERVQEIEVYLNFIGKVELPAQELSEEELAEMKEKQRIRERNAMYQRRRRAKFMPKTKAILTETDGVERERAFAEAQAQAEERLKADDTSHIASVVARENKVIVESGIFPTKEDIKDKYAI